MSPDKPTAFSHVFTHLTLLSLWHKGVLFPFIDEKTEVQRDENPRLFIHEGHTLTSEGHTLTRG